MSQPRDTTRDQGAAPEGSAPEVEAGTGMKRREFLRLGASMAAATAMASTGCQAPIETTVPFNDMPETLAAGLGKARFYASSLHGSPVLVRTREGRPLLVIPNEAGAANSQGARDGKARGMTVRDHAALMDLYDPDRASGPLSIRRGQGSPTASTWAHIGEEVVRRLAGNARANDGEVVLLTPPLSGPGTQAAISALATQTGLRHVSYAPIEAEAEGRAWTSAFGGARRPRPRLDRAAVVVGFGTEFMDRPEDGLEQDFAMRRSPEAGQKPMSRFVQFEGRLTLTGANADRRVRVRDSQLAALAAAVAHELIVSRGQGPLAQDAAAHAALAPYSPAAVAKRSGVDAAVIVATAGELLAAKGSSLVLAGGSASTASRGDALELAVLLINDSLGNYQAPVFDHAQHGAALHSKPPANTGARALIELVEDMRAGTIATLIVAGANPVYDAPAELDFAKAMARVPFIVSLNDRHDETSALADFLAPASHAFECWGDAEHPGGILAIQQPVIQPLADTHGLLDVIIAWAAGAGVRGTVGAAAARTSPPPDSPPGLAAPNPSGAYHFLRAIYAERWIEEALDSPAFELAWNDLLRTGSLSPKARPARRTAPRFIPASLASLAAGSAPTAGEGSALELQCYPDFALWDGRGANNGWLQEFPDPITRISWGGAVSIAPKRFDDMGLENGDLVTITVGERSLTLPAYRHAGMHEDQLAVPLGLGRSDCGAIGADVGVNAFALRPLADGRALGAGLPVTLTKATGNETLAFAQGSDVIDRDRRPIVPTTTLSSYEKDPKAGTEQTAGGPSAWGEHEYKGARWAMVIDLSKCNGCGKCSIGCQAENNIPVVGRQGIIDGREMSWIRIDRYYDAPKKESLEGAEAGERWGAEVWDGPLEVVEEPSTLFEPMLCQHCENAPCETVCPFVATLHSDDGLNQQIYNRCVGTRYCANNCPFKVRRYNWFEYSHPQDNWFFTKVVPKLKRHAELNTRGSMQMKNNPEVTVRSRGVMEKCSFCVQRIREARAEAIRDGKPTKHFDDGSVVPACMEVCPTGAIVFGDINDPGSRVHKLAANPRAMKLLEAIGIKPSVSYLTKVRNDKANT